MTTATLETFAANYDRNFILLLEDWGRWERTAAKVQGWGKGRSDPPHFVDDKTAMIINAACGRLKKQNEVLFKVLELRYIQDLDSNEILRILKSLIEDKRARYMRESFIDCLVEKVSKMLFEELKNA